MTSTPYTARMYRVRIFCKDKVLFDQKIAAFSRDHAAMIVWDKGPDEVYGWESIKLNMAKYNTGFIKVHEEE